MPVGLPAAEVDKAGVHTVALQQLRGIPGAVGLTDAGQHFPHGVQVLLQGEVAVLAKSLQVLQAFPGAVQALVDELVGPAGGELITEQLPVDAVQMFAQRLQRLLPAGFVAAAGKKPVHTVAPGFFVIQQRIGHAGIGRHHEHAPVQGITAHRVQYDVVAHRGVVAHGRAADFFYTDAVVTHYSHCLPCRV